MDTTEQIIYKVAPSSTRKNNRDVVYWEDMSEENLRGAIVVLDRTRSPYLLDAVFEVQRRHALALITPLETPPPSVYTLSPWLNSLLKFVKKISGGAAR